MGSSRSPACARPVAAPTPHVAVRTCVGCRRKAAKTALVRLVRRGDTVEVGRAPGRGAYVCPDRRCLEAALRDRGAALARALRCRSGRMVVKESAIAAEVVAAAHGGPRRGVRE